MLSSIDKENDNAIFYDESTKIHLNIEGKHNRIKIGKKRPGERYWSLININITGDNNFISIANNHVLRDLTITVGNYISMNNTITKIGENFSTNPGCLFLVSNPRSRLIIGDNCIFSQRITIRTGEVPHLIFDRDSGEYLDRAESVEIGSHVWVGEYVYIGKRARIPDNCIIGACAVVTKPFDRPNCLIAGNPATIRKRNITWFTNREEIDNNSIYAKNFDSYWEAAMRLPDEFTHE